MRIISEISGNLQRGKAKIVKQGLRFGRNILGGNMENKEVYASQAANAADAAVNCGGCL